jgi:hypothetical protein
MIRRSLILIDAMAEDAVAVVIAVIVARDVVLEVAVIVIPEVDAAETAMIAADDVTVMIHSEMMTIDSHRTSATMMMALSRVVEAAEVRIETAEIVAIGVTEVIVTEVIAVKDVADVSVNRVSRLS